MTKQITITAIKDFGFITKGTVIKATMTDNHFNGLVVVIANADMPVSHTINPSPMLVRNGQLVSKAFAM